jgi:hypothetical protein
VKGNKIQKVGLTWCASGALWHICHWHCWYCWYCWHSWHVIYIVPFLRQMQNWFRNRVFVILCGLTHSALAIFSWEKSLRALQNVCKVNRQVFIILTAAVAKNTWMRTNIKFKDLSIANLHFPFFALITMLYVEQLLNDFVW